MQTAICKLLLSNLTRQLCHPPKTSILGRYVPAIDFSTSNSPSTSMRGERRRDDRSEDLFLRSLDFGGDGVEEQRRAHQEALPDRPSPGPSLRGGQQRRKEQPLRGEDGVDGAADDLFSMLDMADLDRTGRGPRGRYPNRAMRRDPPREYFGWSPQSPFKDYGRDYLAGFGTSPKELPPRSADGPRAEELGDGSPSAGNGMENSDRVGESLAQNLNFGEVGRREKVEVTAESAEQEAPPEDADEIFKRMKETGLIPNAAAMLDGLCKDGLVQEAMKVFGSMREKGTMPEVVIYTAAVEGFCKAAKFDDAKRIFKKMQKKGIAPNAFSYKILIQGLCKGKKLEDAVEFCMEMVDSGHSLSAATLIGLVDGFCKEKGKEEAEDVVKRLQERGFVLDVKAVKEHLDKIGPFSPLAWKAISRGNYS